MNKYNICHTSTTCIHHECYWINVYNFNFSSFFTYSPIMSTLFSLHEHFLNTLISHSYTRPAVSLRVELGQQDKESSVALCLCFATPMSKGPDNDITWVQYHILELDINLDMDTAYICSNSLSRWQFVNSLSIFHLLEQTPSENLCSPHLYSRTAT